jgi:5-methylcytosine-specific restriction endonuclease McrA
MKKYNYETEVECYLTGDKINIVNGDYHLDHIFPKSRGGSNTIDNIAITTPEANLAKGALTISEFLDLCEKVLKHHNYTVIKPE